MSADIYLGIIGACAVLSTLALLTIAFALIKLVKRQLTINASFPIYVDIEELYEKIKSQQKMNTSNGRIEVL